MSTVSEGGKKGAFIAGDEAELLKGGASSKSVKMERQASKPELPTLCYRTKQGGPKCKQYGKKAPAGFKLVQGWASLQGEDGLYLPNACKKCIAARGGNSATVERQKPTPGQLEADAGHALPAVLPVVGVAVDICAASFRRPRPTVVCPDLVEGFAEKLVKLAQYYGLGASHPLVGVVFAGAAVAATVGSMPELTDEQMVEQYSAKGGADG